MTGPTLIATFRAEPHQIPWWQDRSPVMLLTGSAGGGKSKLAAEKLHGYCLRYPGATALALRKTRESMSNSTVLVLARDVIGDDPSVRHVESKHRFEYANGSILAYGGMANDEQREQIRSIGQSGSVDIVWMEEANKFTEDDYNEVLARMRGKAAPWRQIILTTNPDHGKHWIKRRLIDGGEATVYYSTAADNPHNAPDYLATLDSLTGLARKRLRDGLWVQAEGAVYDQFDDALHVIDPFPIPADWRRIRSIDFGYTNPFVCQWWALDEDSRLYLYREIYMTRRLVADHAQQINALTGTERILLTTADHDAEDRATLDRAGIGTVPATKDISPGIQRVQQRLVKAGDGKPRLFVMRGALVEVDRGRQAAGRPICTLEEFGGYVYPEAKEGKPEKETPVDMDDHGMDAMRYAVMALDWNLVTGAPIRRPMIGARKHGR